MDGIEKITGRIEADAEREIEAIQAQARAQGRRSPRAMRRRPAGRARRSCPGPPERRRAGGAVGQRGPAGGARKLELAAKQEMLEKAFDRALEQL